MVAPYYSPPPILLEVRCDGFGTKRAEGTAGREQRRGEGLDRGSAGMPWVNEKKNKGGTARIGPSLAGEEPGRRGETDTQTRHPKKISKKIK